MRLLAGAQGPHQCGNTNEDDPLKKPPTQIRTYREVHVHEEAILAADGGLGHCQRLTRLSSSLFLSFC